MSPTPEKLKFVTLSPKIVPDATWPDMYRIRRPNGSLSDMVNLTRAKDALDEATPNLRID
jgi:hypothetical protein